MLWRLIKWLKPSIEDNSGQASYKRLTIFAFVLASLGAFVNKAIDTTYMLHAYYANLILIAVMMGWVTVPQLIELVKTKNNAQETNSNSETNSTDTGSDNFNNLPQL